MFCVDIIVDTATVDLVQWYCVLCGVLLVTATVVIVHWYCVGLEINVVTATIDIVQCYCVVCGDYCSYSNSRYSAMFLCFVCRLLWLHQQ